MNETTEQLLLSLMNYTATNTMAVQSSTNSYLLVSIVSILSSSLIYVFLFRTSISNIITFSKVRILLKRYSELTGRKVIVMNHAQSGLFGSMITMSDALAIERILRRFRGQGVDLIVNTFGGDLFASIRIANLLKNNPNVNVIVPKYAWSGGTLISMGANRIFANRDSIFGAVDPQFGSLFSSFSAKYWQKIYKVKKKESKDESIAMAVMGKQLMKEMKNYLESLVNGKNIDRKRFYDVMLEGNYTHGNMIPPSELKKIGFDVQELKTDLPDRIIEGLKDESGIFAYPRK